MILFDETARVNEIIRRGAESCINELEFFEKEIQKFKNSPVRHDMLTGERYYSGEHDILARKRKIIGIGGELEEVKNIPNNRLVDNQYGKMVDQKTNYLLSKPLTFNGKNEVFIENIKNIFGRKFMRIIKRICEDSLNGGIGWLYVYIDDKGSLSFCRFRPWEILPFWADSDHTVLECAVRLYNVTVYEGLSEKIVEKVEIYKNTGIERYVLDGTRLVADMEKPLDAYITDSRGQAYSWNKLPFIAFKGNSKEIPLIKRVKSIQDALNEVRSDFMNNMQEDNRNTILIVKNYDGTDLGELRHNLSQFGAVKVSDDGNVDTLKIEVNSDNYTTICDMLKKAIIENARGYDARDERMNSNPNQMNIQSMYSDIDLDANGMETEYQAAFDELMEFVKIYLENSGKGSFMNEVAEVIFNKDQLISESDVIANCRASDGIISKETIISQHPWVNDVAEEMKRLEEENKSAYTQPIADEHTTEGD